MTARNRERHGLLMMLFIAIVFGFMLRTLRLCWDVSGNRRDSDNDHVYYVKLPHRYAMLPSLSTFAIDS